MGGREEPPADGKIKVAGRIGRNGLWGLRLLPAPAPDVVLARAVSSSISMDLTGPTASEAPDEPRGGLSGPAGPDPPWRPGIWRARQELRGPGAARGEEGGTSGPQFPRGI